MEFISHSPTETEALGEHWGRVAPSGLVLALSGDLGAGKTQLVKGIACGLEGYFTLRDKHDSHQLNTNDYVHLN
jgi:tRNA A37 threonylcarbamoyladenosine biosynthesis protein TsaE